MSSWGDIWSGVQAGAATVAVIVAASQIYSARREQKGWKTLEACERYDRDPIIVGLLTTLRNARDGGNLKSDPRPFRMEVSLLSNYFDGIATGTIQGFYNETIVKDHLEPIIKDHFDEFFEPEMARRMAFRTDLYPALKALLAKWNVPDPKYRN